MQKKFKACLVLGCNGNNINGFCNCSSVDNSIINLAELSDDIYDEVYQFLDIACDLFSVPTNDYNKVVNILSILYKTHKAYNYDMLCNIQLFIKTHRECGLWLSLFMLEDYENGQA